MDPQLTTTSPGRPVSSEESVASAEQLPPKDEGAGEHENDLRPTSTQQSIAATLSFPREVIFVSVICLAQFTTQAGLAQALSIIHIIADTYDLTNPGDLVWLIAGYSLTVGSFILIAGRFGDVYGYKKMLIIGYSWYALWSVLAGAAYYSNHVFFVFARVLEGIGPAITMPNGLAILGATYAPGPRKNMIFALFGATAPGGAVTGAVFAAIFGQLAGFWPWAFWSFGITLAALAVIGAIAVPSPPRQEQMYKMTAKEKIRQLDLVGGFLGITALVLINFAWNQSGVATWHEPYVYVCLILGIVVFAPAFFYWERHAAVNPLIPFGILSADVPFVLGCVACGWGSFGIWIYYFWNFLIVVRGDTPMVAAAEAVPLAITGAIAAVTTGFLLGRLRAAWVMTIALTAFTTGIILIATTPPDQVYWAQTFVCTLVITFGMDMSFPAATVILSNSLPRDRQGIGASLVNTVVNYSISLALGFAGTIEANVANGNTLKGYRSAWYFAIGLDGLGLGICALFLLRSYRSSTAKPSPEDPEQITDKETDTSHS